MRFLCLVAAVSVFLFTARPNAQNAGPAFEVASVKANKSGNPGGFGILPGGTLRAERVTLTELISAAYGRTLPLYRFQIVGGPDWMDTDRFDVVAKWQTDAGPGTAEPRPEQMFLMLRKLLAERFKMAAHEETREAPIYVLALAKPDGSLGPRLRRSETTCPLPDPSSPPPSAAFAGQCVYTVGYGVLKGRGTPIARLALSLANFYGIGRLVVDRTGLTGGFDMDMEWAPLVQFRQPGNLDPPADAADRPVNAGSTIFVALQEQLGLKMDSQRGPVPIVVIDRADKPTVD
jgi:uncharacterized protein (TIGR03435 family)